MYDEISDSLRTYNADQLRSRALEAFLSFYQKNPKKLVNTNFCLYLFLRVKKESYCASAYLGEWQIFENFASTYLCEWQVFENFEFINFSPKEKRIRKKQLSQRTFGQRFCQDQRKDKQATMEKLLLFIDCKKKLNQPKNFVHFFFVNLFSRNMSFLHIWHVFIFTNAF